MMSIDDLKIGDQYKGEAGLGRKIVGFWQVKMGRSNKRVRTPHGAVIEYVRIDGEGNELPGTAKCEATTFAKWASEKL